MLTFRDFTVAGRGCQCLPFLLTYPQIMGTGQGRGLALFFVVIGLALILSSAVALSLPRLRNVDSEIPNVKIKVQSEEAAAQEALEPEATTA